MAALYRSVSDRETDVFGELLTADARNVEILARSNI
jgi:hypothetical protein